MHSNRAPPPPYPVLTVALFGKSIQLKNTIGSLILQKNYAFVASKDLVMAEDSSFRIISTPDLDDEACQHPDQQMIDFMAISHPGVDLFVLAIDSKNTQEETVMAQVKKLQDIFGEEISAHLVVIFPDIQSFAELNHLSTMFSISWATNEKLAQDLRKLCNGRNSFLYNYKNYSQGIVTRRKIVLEKRLERSTLKHQGGADAEPVGLPATPQHASVVPVHGDIFNIVLVGLTGTGKSASANTILVAGNSNLDSQQLFRSEPSSVPITTQCEFKMMDKPSGMSVRVVDTPDFFHDQLKHSQAQIDECKKFCQPGQCVLLLVFQLGRFTDEEKGILEKLENKLGWNIRDSTIVLLTHGEDLKGNLGDYVSSCDPLRKIISLCSNRYHLFNNSSKDNKQVIELIKKIPNCQYIFPKLPKKKLVPECFIC